MGGSGRGREPAGRRHRASPSACRSRRSTLLVESPRRPSGRMNPDGRRTHARPSWSSKTTSRAATRSSRRLARRGYRVVAGGRRPRGRVASAHAAKPDLILMDLGLPGIDGWEATRQLKSDAATRHIPIIVLSAHAMTNDREHGARGGRRRLRHQAGPVPAAAREDRSAACEGSVAPMTPQGSLLRRRRQRGRIATCCRGGWRTRAMRVDGRRRAAPRRWRCVGGSAVRSRPARRRDARHERARRARPPARDPLATELPVIMVTARTRGRRHRRGVPPGRERLRHQADRFSRRARPHRHAPVAQVGRRGPARERGALRARRARRQRRAVGLESRRPTRSTGRRAGRRCSATTKRRSAPAPTNGSTRVHPDDVERVEERADGASRRAAAATTRASTACSIATARIRWVLCRGAAVSERDGRARRALPDRSPTSPTRKVADRADRAAESAAVRRPARPRDQARRRRSRTTCFALLVLGLDRFKIGQRQPGTADRRPSAGRRRAVGCSPACAPRTPSRQASRVHAGAARRRRVHGAPRRHHRRQRRHPRGRTAAAGAREAVRRRRAPGVHVRHRRHRASAPPAIAEPEDILRDAAIALHRAKAHGSAVRALRPGDAGARRVSRLQLETDLRTRDRRIGQFAVHYQPIVSLETRRHRGLRGAGPVAASDARTARPGRVHSCSRRTRG